MTYKKNRIKTAHKRFVDKKCPLTDKTTDQQVRLQISPHIFYMWGYKNKDNELWAIDMYLPVL